VTSQERLAELKLCPKEEPKTIRRSDNMKGITKPKGFGIAAILAMALLAMGGFGYATDDTEPLVPQRVNITTKVTTQPYNYST
jgi:hypothetical protein